MKVFYIYMYYVNHENRYVIDRMMHIFWVLSILVLAQFHLLHISSFSFINCMSEQIIESLENHELNHTYALKSLSSGSEDASFDQYTQDEFQKLDLFEYVDFENQSVLIEDEFQQDLKPVLLS